MVIREQESLEISLDYIGVTSDGSNLPGGLIAPHAALVQARGVPGPERVFMSVKRARNDEPDLSLPSHVIDRIIQPVVRFMHVEAASGGVLLLFTIAALVLANSPLAPAFMNFWNTPVGVSVGAFEFRHSLKHLINDGLMAIFFFVVGLEVKRELVLGELREVRRAMLPLLAALGGAIAPAAIYLYLLRGQPGGQGWGIPMATDIAFVVGCMALLGPRVPHPLRVMLLTLAIADDIFAILVIALGYSAGIRWPWLGAALSGLAIVYLSRKAGVRSFGVFTVLAFAVWYAFHESGIHATVAGVALGLLTPARNYVTDAMYRQVLDRAGDELHGSNGAPPSDLPARLRRIQWLTREVISPLEYLLNALHPWVAFGIMPLFAFANAGVPVRLGDLGEPVALAIMYGLVLGKPIGIVVASWLAVTLRIAERPTGVGWPAIIGAGCLGGIGFTMALFIAGLALQDALLDMAKIGVLAASLISAVLGMLLLRVTLPDQQSRSPLAAPSPAGGRGSG
jgi:NhaA family Na+:H+ antiporter